MSANITHSCILNYPIKKRDVSVGNSTFHQHNKKQSERKMKKKVKITNFYERNNDKVITNINLI